MKRENILNHIIIFLEERGEVPKNEKELLEYRYLDIGHIDSFGIIQLMMLLKEEFDIELKYNEPENLELVKTVGGLAKLVERRIKEVA